MTRQIITIGHPTRHLKGYTFDVRYELSGSKADPVVEIEQVRLWICPRHYWRWSENILDVIERMSKFYWEEYMITGYAAPFRHWIKPTWPGLLAEIENKILEGEGL